MQKRSLPDVLSQCIFEWEKLFQTLVLAVLNRTILNVLDNFISNETIVCNDRDPPWFNDKIGLLIKEKTTAYKYFC